MAIVPDQSPTSAPTEADFGANDWLLEEMYEQYAADPTSVDETWAEYFKTHGAPITDDRKRVRHGKRSNLSANRQPNHAAEDAGPTADESGSGARSRASFSDDDGDAETRASGGIQADANRREGPADQRSPAERSGRTRRRSG